MTQGHTRLARPFKLGNFRWKLDFHSKNPESIIIPTLMMMIITMWESQQPIAWREEFAQEQLTPHHFVIFDILVISVIIVVSFLVFCCVVIWALLSLFLSFWNKMESLDVSTHNHHRRHLHCSPSSLSSSFCLRAARIEADWEGDNVSLTCQNWV